MPNTTTKPLRANEKLKAALAARYRVTVEELPAVLKPTPAIPAPAIISAPAISAPAVPPPRQEPRPAPEPLNEFEIAGRARRAAARAERAEAIAAEKAIIDRRIAAYEAGKVVMHKRALKMREVLVERFPKCFQPFCAAKLPLKIGIYKDILAVAPDLNQGDVGNAVKDYTEGSTYQRALIEGAARVDLDGNPCGDVSKGDAKGAAKMLKRLAGAS